MTDEATVNQALQTTIQAMAAFANADVVINDWSVMDATEENAPYVIITAADTVEFRQDVQTPTSRWEIPVYLVEAFGTWKETYDNFITRREALKDAFNSTTNDARSGEGISGFTIDLIRTDSPIEDWYDPYIPPEQIASADPQFILQRLIFVCTEY